MTEPRPRVAFGYTSGGDDDTGWGCVYRCVQNVQAYTGLPVWTLRQLVRFTQRPWGAWSEPADFKSLFRSYPEVRVRAFLLGGPSSDWLRYTTARQYSSLDEVSLPTFEWNVQASYVIDNGISGYAVVSYRDKHWFIDPHTIAPKPVPFKRSRLSSSSGWMVLEVLPPSQKNREF